MQSHYGDHFVKSVDGTYGEGSFAVSHLPGDRYRYEGIDGTIDGPHHVQAGPGERLDRPA